MKNNLQFSSLHVADKCMLSRIPVPDFLQCWKSWRDYRNSYKLIARWKKKCLDMRLKTWVFKVIEKKSEILVKFSCINTLWVEKSSYKKAFDLLSRGRNKSNRTWSLMNLENSKMQILTVSELNQTNFVVVPSFSCLQTSGTSFWKTSFSQHDILVDL